ncbi:hypothetical protein C5167_018648 [Papaver somniferum]|uniref:Uncharacterized protein n=1 Tax=Papaver somniferum TaxID=3469 RepID=A0A4Y7IRW8_PAPSO|nr:hypothetical protein C5167_018648 [Papaver somniferum]
MGHKSEADHTVANLTCSNSQMISQSPTLHASFQSVNKLDFQNEFNFKLECLSEDLEVTISQSLRFPFNDVIFVRILADTHDVPLSGIGLGTRVDMSPEGQGSESYHEKALSKHHQ